MSFGQLPSALQTTFLGIPGLRRALLVVAFGSDGRKKAAAAAGAARAVADAMASFPSYPQLQRWGVRALLTLAAGDLPDAAATPVRWEEARTPYDA